MESLLLISLLIGMRHALDADHVAAVATLVSRHQTLSNALRQGSVWGLGHTITLLLFGSVVVFMDWVVPDQLASWLEIAVGMMLILLGADVLVRLIRDRVHFHAHRHGQTVHFHAHSHVGEERNEHDPEHHHHDHPAAFPLRALFVGMVHGMAGSAAVILLALEEAVSPLQGVVYILIFGFGSMLGMAILSVVISIPMRFSEQKLTHAFNGIQLLLGVFTIALGLFVIYEKGAFSFA